MANTILCEGASASYDGLLDLLSEGCELMAVWVVRVGGETIVTKIKSSADYWYAVTRLTGHYSHSLRFYSSDDGSMDPAQYNLGRPAEQVVDLPPLPEPDDSRPKIAP